MPAMKITKSSVEKAKLPEPGVKPVILWDEQLKGFGVVLHAPSPRHPHGKRSYVARYRLPDGTDRRMVLGAHGEITQEQARAAAQDVLGTARRGGDPLADKREARRSRALRETVGTVEKAFETWHAQRVRLGKWKGSTAKEVERIFRVDVLPKIGALDLAQVTRPDVRAVLEAKAGAPYLFNRLRTWLSAFLAWAEREELRPPGSNVAASIERHAEKPRDRALTLDELAHVGEGLRAQEETHSAACDALRLLALTGLRKREVTRLRWEHVDLGKGFLRIVDAKTGDRMKVLSHPARLLLARREADRGENPWVFPSARKPSVPVDDLRDVIAGACAERGEQAAVEPFSTHTLRHTYSTWATQARINPLVVALLLGHRKRGVTEGYIHVDAEDEIVREAEERVGGMIARALAGASADVIDLDARRAE